MIIPYRKYKDREGNLIELPIVSVFVKCNGVAVPIWGLVDSGSDITLLNASFAELFKVPTKKGKRIDLVGVLEGPEFAAYIHQINLTVKDVGSVDTIAAFTDSEKYPDHMLLGRRGFFDKFMIKFEQYNKQIEINPRP